MIRILPILLLFITISGCSEGDIIETSFRFDGELQSCGNENTNTFVFFIVDQEINRSLSVNFASTSFQIEPTAVSNISLDEPTIITLNTTTNQFLYREFDTAINGDEYYCNSIPPSNINVSQELIGSNGTAEISYAILDESDPTETIYSRTITLKDITLEGNGIAIREEIFVLGSDTISIPN